MVREVEDRDALVSEVGPRVRQGIHALRVVSACLVVATIHRAKAARVALTPVHARASVAESRRARFVDIAAAATTRT